MAYLAPTLLTCATCGLEARIEIVVGEGPASRKGDIPYRSYNDPAPFVKEVQDDKRTGRLLCPEDGTPVWTNQPGRRAFGPLTAKEMQGRHGRAWLVPGTDNPFPPEPPSRSSRTPFSGPGPIKPG